MDNTQLINKETNKDSFKTKTIDFLISRNFSKDQVNDKDKIVNLIVKYFEASNTINGHFENYHNGYEAWESDYDLAKVEYYPEFLEAWKIKNN